MDDLGTQTTPPLEENQPQKRFSFQFLIIFLLLLVIGLVAIIFMMKNSSPSLQNSEEKSEQKIVDAVVSNPYEELTVPYLREREYNGELGERQAYASYSSFTAYLTSYTSDELKINGLLTIPAGDMPAGGWPAIVFIHGYIPPTQYVTTEKYVDYVNYLASNGFVVFKIDLRGHGESEGEPGGGYYASDYVIDALNAYTALEKADFVNPKKIGMWGHSMAGNVVLRSMAARPSIPASVIWAGAVYSYLDQRKYGIQDTSYRPPETATRSQSRRRDLFEKVGSPSAEREFWKQVAPINYLSDMKGAIALHHAVNDDVVNIGYSRDLTEALEKTSVPHEFYEYATGGHNIEGTSFSLAIQRTVDFFKKYL